MERLSDVRRETEGQVFLEDEFAAHLERVAASEDDLPADGFFAIGAGGPPDASRRVEDFVGPAIDRRHPTSVSTSEKPQAKPRGAWTAEEVARHERAIQAQIAHDRKRGVSVNLEEAAKLSRFANRFSEAFRHARRDT